MLRFIYADELYKYGTLGQEMFRDRAEQFRDRLGWDVHVDADGREMDEYDQLNPLYVIWEMPNGRHGGSMRFLSQSMTWEGKQGLCRFSRVDKPPQALGACMN